MSADQNSNPIKFKLTGRDGWQSNHAMMVESGDVVGAYAHIGEYGVASAQTMGGTTDDLSIKYGRSPAQHMKEIGSHHAQAGVTQTALIRGEVGFGYERQPLDVLKASIERAAKAAGGALELQNFNAMNDINMMRGVTVAAQQLNQEQGLDVKVRGGICIQENPDTQDRRGEIIAEYVDHARDLIASGHEDFYLKCANGVLPEPSFVADIITALKSEFPEQEIDIHLHNTYGYAPAVFEAAVAAGADGFDLLPDALAEGTAQMSVSMAMHILENSADPKVRARKPDINFEAMKADADAAYRTRAAYSDTEFPYNRENLKKAEAAGSAGGAISALKKIDGLIPSLANVLNVAESDWDTIRNAIYERKEDNRKALGYPTNVTPLEFMQDIQAASELLTRQEPLKSLHPMTVAYLTGQLGKVSSTVDRGLQNKAFEQVLGLNALLPGDDVDPNEAIEKLGLKPQPIEELEPGLPQARQKLIESGIEDPTEDQVLNVALSQNGLKYELGEVKPLERKTLPEGFNEGEAYSEIAPRLIEAAYTSVTLRKLSEGFFGNEDWYESYEQGLKGKMCAINTQVQEYMSGNDFTAEDKRKMRYFAYSLATKLGGETSVMPSIVLKNNASEELSPFKNEAKSFQEVLSSNTGLSSKFETADVGQHTQKSWQSKGNPSEPDVPLEELAQ